MPPTYLLHGCFAWRAHGSLALPCGAGGSRRRRPAFALLGDDFVVAVQPRAELPLLLLLFLLRLLLVAAAPELLDGREELVAVVSVGVNIVQ